MGLNFTVKDKKRIRVLIDTDAACEADDPFAIAHALMSPKLIVKGILAEHFNEAGSVERSYDEIRTILDAMKTDVPVLMGEKYPLKAYKRIDYKDISPAAEAIIKEALTEDSHPLYVLCQGAVTNVATAILACPEIIGKMTVVWIGTHSDKPEPIPFREFNAGNDVIAANILLQSQVDLKLITSKVYTTVNVGLAELQKKVLPCGDIGRHLFENMVTYNMSSNAGWTQGESWSLGDSPAVAVTLNPGCGHSHISIAPVIGETTATLDAESGEAKDILRQTGDLFGRTEREHKITVYDDIDTRYLLEDFFAKLELNYLNILL